jgi:hypothetical protein
MIVPYRCRLMIQTGKQGYMKITGSSFSSWKVYFFSLNSTVSECSVSVGRVPRANRIN